MVHALKEGHRILIPHGSLIDLRPLSIDMPLEVLYEGGGDCAGMIDTSPGVELDMAADRAIALVVGEHYFREENVEYFKRAYFWDTFQSMKADLDEFWKEDVIITAAVLKKTQRLMRVSHPQKKIHIAVQAKLGRYTKL